MKKNRQRNQKEHKAGALLKNEEELLKETIVLKKKALRKNRGTERNKNSKGKWSHNHNKEPTNLVRRTTLRNQESEREIFKSKRRTTERNQGSKVKSSHEHKKETLRRTKNQDSNGELFKKQWRTLLKA